MPIIPFDLGKGMLAVWIAHLVGLDVTQQVIVGLATIVGHNWSVFLRFGGGRGMLTTLGVALILPLINGMICYPQCAAWGRCCCSCPTPS